jgi:hypothetical protein
LDRDWTDERRKKYLMWNVVYDKNGRQVNNGVERFKEALRGPHTVTTKVEMLDENLDPVEDGDLFSADVENELTNFITDGSVDVDVSRGTRRTSEITLLNPSAEFTPATQGYDSEGDWVGKLYLDRNVRVHRGLYYNGQALYAPVGTFMIDGIDVQVEQNMSQVILTMSDRWKKLSKSFFANHKTYDKGTLYNDIIIDMVHDAGILESQRTLDGLGKRDSDDRKIHRDLKVDAGASRGDLLKKYCKKWNIDIFFNPLGRLVSEDRTRPRDKASVWKYHWSDDSSGMLVNMTRSFSDDNLYNHVVVRGMKDTEPGNGKTMKPFFVEKKNTNPASKFCINRMGDRVLFIDDDSINTVAEANKALERAWSIRTQMSESVRFQAISNPLLEGDDNITLEERNYAKLDDRYRLQRFDIPLVTSLQTLEVHQILKGDDL